MHTCDTVAVSVTSNRTDWRAANARLGDLRDVHWHQPMGAPHPVLHAYVSCADVSGDLLHHCDASSAPHVVRVCILKSRNTPGVYAALAQKADAGSGAVLPTAQMSDVTLYARW
jgi:hypothetical protein